MLWGVYTIQQTSSNSRVFWIHLLEVCWRFAGSCKHSISGHCMTWIAHAQSTTTWTFSTARYSGCRTNTLQLSLDAVAFDDATTVSGCQLQHATPKGVIWRRPSDEHAPRQTSQLTTPLTTPSHSRGPTPSESGLVTQLATRQLATWRAIRDVLHRDCKPVHTSLGQRVSVTSRRL